MIRINKHYLQLFKYFGDTYNYYIDKGVWLSFDRDTFEYIGLTTFYQPYNYNALEQIANSRIDKLIAKDILEVID